MSFTTSFTQRRRGVETKLIIGGIQVGMDQTPLKNVANGHRYFDMICSGLSHAHIAEPENTSKRMVQQLSEFAFLSPDITDRICSGTHPAGLTTEWLKRNKLPELWFDQTKPIDRL